ncbi:glycoside hydrolase family 2 protein [Cerasicoccus fimbriatus]|uniref:glycoside hydrolase family 2 protein n=1 Tax=Cerasicoccus fimbriatus TaxID=3014554 RepID=UPI0022B4ABC9|nr:sugar-binding domain-containing protein [Cerasicoccus sp. TK19100]
MSLDYTIEPCAAPRTNLDLNGEWDIAFDPDNCGKQNGWEKSFPGGEKITVPSTFETIRPFYDGVVWYRRTINATTSPGQRHRLHFGAAQYFAEAWLNGARIGDHEGGLLPFVFDVSDQLTDGDNELIVRVVAPPMDREIDGFRCGAPLNQGSIPIAKLGWYFNVGGLWKGVSLQTSQTAAIGDVFLEPWPSRNELKVHCEIDSSVAIDGAELRLTVTDWQGAENIVLQAVESCSLEQGITKVSFTAPFENARRWTLADPHLYQATLTLSTGEHALDAEQVRFGMREFDYVDGEFQLNGERVCLKGFLHQGDFPRTAIYPDSHEIVLKELQQIKDLGFNFIRCHMRPHYEVLDVADELGLLVMSEPPIGWIANSPETANRCWREISGLVKNDRNRACVVMWGLMNEVFHLKGFKPQEMMKLVVQWLQDVYKMDPTRPVIDVSGGHSLVEYGGVSDMLPDTAHDGNVAYMLSPSQPKPTPITDTHSYHRVPTQDKSWQDFRALGSGDKNVFVSEYGAAQVPPMFDDVLAAYSDADREIGLEDYRMNVDFNESLEEAFANDWLREAVGEKNDWLRRTNELRAADMKLVTFAMRANPKVSGLVFTQLADASGELFGAMDTWRNPKPMLTALAESCADDTIALFPSQRVIEPGQEFRIEAMLMHESAAGPHSWSIALQSEQGKIIQGWSGELSANAEHRSVLLDEPALTLDRAGAYQVSAKLTLANGEVVENSVPLRVIGRAGLKAKEVAVTGSRGGSVSRIVIDEGGVNLPFSNNFREPNAPIVYDFKHSADKRSASTFEDYHQLRKAIKGGGCAIAFEPEPMTLYEYVIPGLIRQRPVMQPNCYSVSPELFDGLCGPGVNDFVLSTLAPTKFDRINDILALGGRIHMGCLSAHMWTRPAVFFHGAAIYELPIGDGTLIICHVPLPELAPNCPVARRLLINLLNYANAKIDNPSITGLLSRSIDPLPGEVF